MVIRFQLDIMDGEFLYLGCFQILLRVVQSVLVHKVLYNLYKTYKSIFLEYLYIADTRLPFVLYLFRVQFYDN